MEESKLVETETTKNEAVVSDILTEDSVEFSPKDSTLQRKYIEALALKVYQTEDLLVDAVEYCHKKGNSEVSMEEYVRRHFGLLLSNFTELAGEYYKEVKDRQNKLRKIRRKLNKKGK